MATDDEEAVMVVADGAILDPKASDFRGKGELVTIEKCVLYFGQTNDSMVLA